MEKMTIHRALAELKLIGARITKAIDALQPSGIVQKDKLVNNLYERTAFEKRAKEQYQSALDLITRRDNIKAAIVKANAVTTVTVAGVSMTIADAINQRASIIYRKSVSDMLKAKYRLSKASLEKNNAQVDASALELAKVALGKQNVKIGDDDVNKVVESYLTTNKFSLVDPVNVEVETEKLDAQVSAFEAEVDATLSEINATTFIEF